MSDQCLKVLFISFNVICLFGGTAMFVGGLLVQYLPVVQQTLLTLNETVTQSQLGGIGVGLIALGALVLFISIVGCCGAINESRCMLLVYFVCIMLLFLAQVAVGVAALVYGFQGFYTSIQTYLQRLVHGYGTRSKRSEMDAVDFVQQQFECCGYNSTQDFRTYKPTEATTAAGMTTTTQMAGNMTTMPMTTMPMTTMPVTSMTVSTVGAATTMPMATSNMTTMPSTSTVPTSSGSTRYWPPSCCKRSGGKYINETACLDTSLPQSTLEEYLNTQGCTAAIEAFVKQNLIIIGAAALGVAFVEVLAMILACCIRTKID